MENEVLNEFAKILVQTVRDSAIESSDSNMNESAKHVMAIRWKQVANKGDIKNLLKVIIPDIVDETIFYLLQCIDTGELKLNYSLKDGQTFKLVDNPPGELAGHYLRNDGWIDQYSNQRKNDYLTDLNK
jgi:hypothetical protein